jgi:hypothetical protein
VLHFNGFSKGVNWIWWSKTGWLTRITCLEPVIWWVL